MVCWPYHNMSDHKPTPTNHVTESCASFPAPSPHTFGVLRFAPVYHAQFKVHILRWLSGAPLRARNRRRTNNGGKHLRQLGL